MPPSRSSDQTSTLFGLAVQLAKHSEADALLVWAEGKTDWESLKKRAGEMTLLVAAETDEKLKEPVDCGLDVVQLTSESAMSIHDRLSQALLQSIADDVLSPGATVIAVYSGFETKRVDSVSVIELDEHLGRLTARDLRSLSTKVPLETLRHVVDLAVEIGREGREGKPVGTLFVVGDSRKVQNYAHPTGFDPVKGYNKKERHIGDPRVREGIKEIAQLDGAFVIHADGTVESACQLIETAAANITMSKG
ncbi:MAG: DNA integrity scanning protein DisA nucleotide-binding domain protein, partial [Pseudomonadota bacterium]